MRSRTIAAALFSVLCVARGAAAHDPCVSLRSTDEILQGEIVKPKPASPRAEAAAAWQKHHDEVISEQTSVHSRRLACEAAAAKEPAFVKR